MYISLGVDSAYETRAALKYGPKGSDHGVSGRRLLKFYHTLWIDAVALCFTFFSKVK